MRGELEKVDAEMKFAKAVLSRMKITRRRIISSMQQHERALRPILSIPDDILRFIFEWNVILCSDTRRQDFLDRKLASPWTLSHICSHWRNVAISHPSLWRNILVPRHEKGSLLLELSLQRSANTGLDVYIEYHEPFGPVVFPLIKMLAPILRPTSQRWRSLIVHDSWHFANLLFSGGWSFKGIIRLDTSLFHHGLFRSLDELDIITTAFRDTPNLTHLSVERLTQGATLAIRWENLVFYACRRSDLKILGRLSAVETLIIDLVSFRGRRSLAFDNLKKIPPIRLPSLHSLSVNCQYYANILSDLSDFMEAPSLRHLTIGLQGATEQIKRCPNVHILEPVTHLSIFMKSSSAYLLDILRCAGRVRVLYLRGAALNASVLHAIKSEDTLPLLEWMHIDNVLMDIFATEVFMVMEAKRCRLCIVNQEKEDYTGARLSVDALENYRALKERGMITTDVNYDFDFF